MAAWSRSSIEPSLLDMSKCPDCDLVQTSPKSAGAFCDNPDCDSEVIEYETAEGEQVLLWTNPNWEYDGDETEA